MHKAILILMALSAPAFANDCQTVISSNDQMQYDKKTIEIPQTCKKFEVVLKHTGKLPKVAMGHNLVVVKKDDLDSVANDAMAAGQANGFIKPDDSRIIAHTQMLGGGESSTITIDRSKLNSNDQYVYFCSFPGHRALMQGVLKL